VSANFIDTISPTDIAKLIIDDGTGLEPSFAGRGFETVVERATGGEQFLQIDLFPIVKASIVTSNEEPYAIQGGMTLIYKVSNDIETITFQNSDFRVLESGNAQEVVTAINDRATLVEARTADDGANVELRAKTNTNEVITIIGGTANAASILNFPINSTDTLKLYRYDGSELTLMEKDGITAILENDNVAPYDFSAFPTNIDIQMDGEIFYEGSSEAGSGLNTLVDTTLSSKFPNNSDLMGKYITFTSGANIGQTHYSSAYISGSNTIIFTTGVTISDGDNYQIEDVETIYFSNQSNVDFVDPSNASVAEVIAVLNQKLHGVASVSSDNSKVVLTSKTENSSNSKIRVMGGTANTILNFSTDEISGKNSDYILNRFNGQLELRSPLIAGESVTAGTRLSRGFLISPLSQPYTLSNGDTITIQVDGGTPQVISLLSADFGDITQATAEEVATVINRDSLGITAYVTSDNKLAIRINTHDDSIGSIKITSVTGLAGNLGFTIGSTVDSIKSHTAFIMSENTGPFNFVEGDNLVVVLDNDATNKTFDIDMNLDGEVTTVGAITNQQFIAKISGIDQSFINKFIEADELVSFRVIFKSCTNPANDDIERTVSEYLSTNGQFTLNAVLPAAITIGDTFTIIPETLKNVVTYLNNVSTSTLSIFGEVELANEGEKVQVSTLTGGSAGYINITGGTASTMNNLLYQNSSGNDIWVENSLWKVGMDVRVNDDDTVAVDTSIVTVTPNDPVTGVYKLTLADAVAGFTTDQNATVSRLNVLDFNSQIAQGIDSYKYYTGLLRRVQWTVDGLEDDQAFPGIKAAGAQIEVLPPLVRKLIFEITIIPQEGLTVAQLSNTVKTTISSYINSLKVGEDVILTEISKRIKSIDGISDLEISTPSENIAIADLEIARVDQNLIIVG